MASSVVMPEISSLFSTGAISELLYPRKLVFRAENLYAAAMEHSSVKEALRLD